MTWMRYMLVIGFTFCDQDHHHYYDHDDFDDFVVMKMTIVASNLPGVVDTAPGQYMLGSCNTHIDDDHDYNDDDDDDDDEDHQ